VFSLKKNFASMTAPGVPLAPKIFEMPMSINREKGRNRIAVIIRVIPRGRMCYLLM